MLESISTINILNMAGLSEAKIERNEKLNDKKTKRQIVYFSEKLPQEFTNENVLIIGNSKVRHLYDEMDNYTFIRTLWRSGANIENEYLTREADKYIRRYNNPAIIA